MPWEETQLPFNMSAGGTQNSFGFFGVRKNLLSLPGIKPYFFGLTLVKCADTLSEEELILRGATDILNEVRNNCRKIKVMRISGQPFAVQILIDQQQNGECAKFELFG